MEKLKNKHDHALTQWLKVIIFGILMLAPFFSVLSRCLYVTCNKNAKDSYSDSYVKQVNEITALSNVIDNETYYVNNINITQDYPVYSVGILYKSIDINVYETFGFSTTLNIVGFQLVRYQNNANAFYTIPYYLDNDNVLQTGAQNWSGNGRTLTSFTYVADRTLSTANTYWKMTGSTKMYNYVVLHDTLDNAFEYSVNQLTQTPIFNWVQNTAIYTPVNAMTTGLGFDSNNNIVALLLTYWAILTAVYVLFDIIISCFVKLTHMVGGNA